MLAHCNETSDARFMTYRVYWKAQFRKGLALAALERWDEAVPTLIEAQRLAPSSTNKEVS